MYMFSLEKRHYRSIFYRANDVANSEKLKISHMLANPGKKSGKVGKKFRTFPSVIELQSLISRFRVHRASKSVLKYCW